MTFCLKHQNRGHLLVAAVFFAPLIFLSGCSTEASKSDVMTRKLIGVWEGQIDADAKPLEETPLAKVDTRILPVARITYKFRIDQEMEIHTEVLGQKAITRRKWEIIKVAEDRVTISITPRKGQGPTSTIVLEMLSDDKFQRVPVDGDGLTATFYRYLSNRE